MDVDANQYYCGVCHEPLIRWLAKGRAYYNHQEVPGNHKVSPVRRLGAAATAQAETISEMEKDLATKQLEEA